MLRIEQLLELLAESDLRKPDFCFFLTKVTPFKSKKNPKINSGLVQYFKKVFHKKTPKLLSES